MALFIAQQEALIAGGGAIAAGNTPNTLTDADIQQIQNAFSNSINSTANMVEWGPLYAYAYLYNLIYGDTQSSGSASNEKTALPEKDKAPTNTGHPPADLSDLPNHTGNNDGQINIGPNHTGGDQSIDQLPNHTGNTEPAPDLPIYVESQGYDPRLPIPEVTTASNGLKIESNTKHTPGAPGFRPNAGIEPKNSLELFGNSVSIDGEKARYSI